METRTQYANEAISKAKEIGASAKKAIRGALRLATILSVAGIFFGVLSIIIGAAVIYLGTATWVDVFGWITLILGVPMIAFGFGIFFIKSKIEENLEHATNLNNLLTGTNVLQTLLGLMLTFSFLRTVPAIAIITIAYTVFAVLKIQKAKRMVKGY